MNVRISAEPFEHLVEERVAVAVVDGDLGRRSHGDEHATAVESKDVEHTRVGLEVGEVVLLLQPREPDRLAPVAPSLAQARRRDRVRRDDTRGRPAAQCRAAARANS